MTAPSSPRSSALPPTRVRYRVVGLVIVLGMVTYLDRVCIATLAPQIMADLGLDKIRMGYVFSAFALAYALFEIPTAQLADRRGTRVVLTRIVTWWSVFTLATAAALNFAMLLVVRFLFGAGEAGAWPCMARTFSRWIPQRERGRVQGIFFAGAHLMGGLTPSIVTSLLVIMPWRLVFVCFGLLGFAWSLVWYRWFRDEPAGHAGVNAAECALIEAGRGAPVAHAGGWAYWRKMLGNRNVLALCVMYVPNSVVFYFCITWLPTYLKEQQGFTAAAANLLAGLPLVLSVTGDLFGGLVTDWVTTRFGLRHGRSTVGVVSYLIAAACLLAVPFCRHPVLAAVLIALAVTATMFSLAGAWATCMDVGREHTGTVGAAMNTAGQVGALLCPVVVAYAVEWFGSWNIPIFIMSALFLAGAAAWKVIDPGEPVFKSYAADRIAMNRAFLLACLATLPLVATGNPTWRPFSPDSPWNQRIPATAAIDPASPALIEDLAARGAWHINIKDWSIPVYFVAADTTPRRDVGDSRPGIYGAGFEFPRRIPIPDDAVASPPVREDSDNHLSIIDRKRGLEWGMWAARQDSSGRWFTGLGAVTDLNGTGVAVPWYDARRELDSHRARASGFPLVAGLILLDEIKAGRIDHALCFAYDHCRTGLFIPPASTSQVAQLEAIDSRGIPMGGRIQLDPAWDVEHSCLSRAGKIIAHALQDYGAYCGDYAGANVLYAENSPSAVAAWEGVLASGDLAPIFTPDFIRRHFRVLAMGNLLPGQNLHVPPPYLLALTFEGSAEVIRIDQFTSTVTLPINLSPARATWRTHPANSRLTVGEQLISSGSGVLDLRNVRSLTLTAPDGTTSTWRLERRPD